MARLFQKAGFRWGVSGLLPGLVCLCLLARPGDAFASTPLAAVGDAYVVEDSRDIWTIGNSQIVLRVGLGPTGTLTVLGISGVAASGPSSIAAAPDMSVVERGRRLSPGQSGQSFREARAFEAAGAVRLELAFDDSASHLRITRVYASAPRSSAIEVWTVFEALNSAANAALSDIGIWQLTVPASEVQWVTGLQASAGAGGRFTRRNEALGAGGSVQLGSTRRSSESAVPAVSLRGTDAHFFGGLLWSGAWSLVASASGSGGQTTVRMSLGATATTVKPGEPFETPHGFYGMAGADPASLAAAWQATLRNGVRQGRTLSPLVTYNTWYAYGNRVDETIIRAQMDRVAELGVELFVLDAGWYAGGTQAADYATGLGTWAADPRRFPSGLRAVADYARSLGMKFGIWIEPEQVDLSTLNRTGLARERFLATAGGRYNAGVKNESASAAQICLADTEARQWVVSQLFRFLDDIRPDYVKWDNNYWINCDRTSHGHGSHDGNLSHVKGLYEILAMLHERYPDMLIENCASGGNRLDFGMLRHTDVAWMDDVSGPSSHVRHNVEGLSAVFPPSYLLSFVMDDPREPIHGAADMTLYFRSRMLGSLGMSLRPEEFGDEDISAMKREVSIYKRTLQTLRDAVPMLLNGQVGAAGGDGWDMVQLASPSTGNSLVYAFDGGHRADQTTIWPQALVPDASYEIRVGRDSAGRSSGAALMSNGVEILSSPESAAHLLLFLRNAGTLAAAP